MLRWPALALLAFLTLAPTDRPAYTADGSLVYPADYAEWVFLGTGIDMSYSASTASDMHVFNTVFANPSAWQSFKQTGHWPEGTILVLENRGAAGATSINKRGKTQTDELMGLEVHVKDSAHMKGDGWAFYNFDGKGPGKLLPRPATCYTCHEAHGVVDTTFVQFYPAAHQIAKEKSTLTPEK